MWSRWVEDAPDEALRWLLSRIRTQPPIGLGLQTTVKSHESTKRTAFYVSAPTNVYVLINPIQSILINYSFVSFSFTSFHFFSSLVSKQKLFKRNTHRFMKNKSAEINLMISYFHESITMSDERWAFQFLMELSYLSRVSLFSFLSYHTQMNKALSVMTFQIVQGRRRSSSSKTITIEFGRFIAWIYITWKSLFCSNEK